MTIHSIFIDFGGVIVRTEDKEPRRLQAEKLGLTSRDLEKIIFESESSHRASTGEITEDDHWQAVAETLAVTREAVDKITVEFFSGDRADISLIDFLRGLRPERKVCLISNAWSGLRTFITQQKIDDVAVNVAAARSVGMTGIEFAQPEKALEELKQILNNHR